MTKDETQARKRFVVWYDSLPLQQRAGIGSIDDAWLGWRACWLTLNSAPLHQIFNPDPDAKGSQHVSLPTSLWEA